MILTPAAASRKWCPLAFIAFEKNMAAVTRDGEKGKSSDNCCMADECMLWRMIPNTIEHVGYCGLGGKPDRGPIDKQE